jgi:ATP-dependent DNA helicase RecQ
LPATPLAILQQHWGYPAFRPLQAEIIDSVMAGRDTLALLPTGGGKSLCFQVPALCLEGVCIVVSPLIALMKDQVFNLQKREINAAAIYSGMDYRSIDRILDNCVYGSVKFLYLSPERLMTELAIERIKRMKVSLIAVDEAHCISQWGYDFRPPYLEIARLREVLPQKVPILALTASATPDVVKDIQEKLEFKNQQVFENDFSRPNLAYIVRHSEGKDEKLLEILQKVPGSGVVYVRNRKRTREVAEYLRRNRISADFYHAGLTHQERSSRQDAWIAGKIRVMVATNAFGMGIDKHDVRSVVHLELPDSLEAYFQEAGRAGRDGQKSFAVLLYNQNDARNLEYQFEQAFPELSEIKQVYRALGSYFQLATGAGQGESFDFDLPVFCQTYQLESIKAFNALRVLEQEGWIMLSESVYTPSTLWIKVSKEQLYDYQIRNKQLDKLIKSILRTYQGVFSQAIQLSESKLANFLNSSTQQVKAGLNALHQDGILEYIPQKDKPQLVLLKERIDANNLNLDQKRYLFRKNRHQERIQKAIAYAEQEICRSQQLSWYFGQQEAQPCGICDVCLERKRKGLADDTVLRLREKILRLLDSDSLSYADLLSAFALTSRQDVVDTLNLLLLEEEVEEVDGKLKLKV